MTFQRSLGFPGGFRLGSGFGARLVERFPFRVELFPGPFEFRAPIFEFGPLFCNHAFAPVHFGLVCDEVLLPSRELCGLRRKFREAGLPRLGLGVKLSLPLVERLRSSVQLALPSRLRIGFPSDRGSFALECLLLLRKAFVGFGSRLFGLQDRSLSRLGALL